MDVFIGLCVLALLAVGGWLSLQAKARAMKSRLVPREDDPKGRGPRPLGPLLDGRDWCDVDIVGESFYQRALQAIAGDDPEGVQLHCWAALVRERDNPKDDQAIAVRISGRTVGYLSRDFAPAYREAAATLGLGDGPVYCRAYVHGGWRARNGKRNHYGVKLGLRQPFRVESRT